MKASSRTYSDKRLGSGGDDGEVGTTFSANTRMLKESKRTTSSSDSAVTDDKYTFDLFIAVAMLIQMREDLFSCNGKLRERERERERESAGDLDVFAYCLTPLIDVSETRIMVSCFSNHHLRLSLLIILKS